MAFAGRLKYNRGGTKEHDKRTEQARLAASLLSKGRAVNVPDDWSAYFARCIHCGHAYHQSAWCDCLEHDDERLAAAIDAEIPEHSGDIEVFDGAATLGEATSKRLCIAAYWDDAKPASRGLRRLLDGLHRAAYESRTRFSLFAKVGEPARIVDLDLRFGDAPR